MKSENFDKHDPQLSALLRQSRPASHLPPRFQQEVWHRIQRAEAAESLAASRTWFDLLLARVARPRLALAAVIALVLLSSAAGALYGSVVAKDAAKERYLTSVAPSAVR